MVQITYWLLECSKQDSLTLERLCVQPLLLLRTHHHHALKIILVLRSCSKHWRQLSSPFTDRDSFADLLSETNLNIAVQKLPGPLQSKWAMEVQKHESQGRPNLFDLDRWLSEPVRARQHLVYEEPVKCPPPNRRKPPKQDRPMNSSTLHIKGDPQPKGEEPTNKEPKSPACLRCNQAHPLYRCNEFKRKSVPERYEVNVNTSATA